MNIVNCPNCSKYVHVGKSFGEVCIFCGNALTFSLEKENSLLMDIIHDCESELQFGNFNEAVKKYDESIDKYPDISMLYWGRFLALHKCNNDIELITEGVIFDTDPDYVSASRFSSDAEKECYNALAKTRNDIAQHILDSLKTSENTALIDTDVVRMNNRTFSEISELQDSVTRQIAELDLIEKSIRDKVADCGVLMDAGKRRINDHVSKLETIKNKLKNLTEATYSETENYTAEMSLNLSVCINEWNDMQALSQKPQFVEYNSLLEKQKETEQAIYNTVRQINQVNERLSRLIGTIGSIKSKYAEARTEVQNGSFAKAKELLRDEVIEQISRNFVST